MQIMVNKVLTYLVFLLVTFYCISFSYAESTTEKNPIKVGVSTSLTGGAAQTGKNLTLGMNIYFDKINAMGGINGRKINLIVKDDGYEPLRAAANLHQLIDQDNVLSIIGTNGTPAAVVAVPIVNQSKILLIGSRSGADFLRKTPPDRYIINLRASYYVELYTLIKGLLVSGIKPEDIAIFTQNDAFGDSIYQASIRALKDLGYTKTENIPYGRYDRNSLDVASALSTIIEHAKHPIKAFILGGVYSPNAQFIKLAKTEFPDALFLSVSGLVNASDLNKDVDSQVLTSQVVPDMNSDLPAAIEYQADLKKYGKGAVPNNASFEGFLAAKLYVMGLEKASSENKLTREGIIDTFESMNNIDLGINYKMHFSKNDHNGFEGVWVTIFKNGKFIETQWPDPSVIKKQ